MTSMRIMPLQFMSFFQNGSRAEVLQSANTSSVSSRPAQVPGESYLGDLVGIEVGR